MTTLEARTDAEHYLISFDHVIDWLPRFTANRYDFRTALELLDGLVAAPLRDVTTAIRTQGAELLTVAVAVAVVSLTRRAHVRSASLTRPA